MLTEFAWESLRRTEDLWLRLHETSRRLCTCHCVVSVCTSQRKHQLSKAVQGNSGFVWTRGYDAQFVSVLIPVVHIVTGILRELPRPDSPIFASSSLGRDLF